MRRKKEQYYREHREEFWELFEASMKAETREEMKRINKKISKLYGRDRTIPVEDRFPSDNTWMWYTSIVLAVLSILLSLTRIILTVMMG